MGLMYPEILHNETPATHTPNPHRSMTAEKTRGTREIPMIKSLVVSVSTQSYTHFHSGCSLPQFNRTNIFLRLLTTCEQVNTGIPQNYTYRHYSPSKLSVSCPEAHKSFHHILWLSQRIINALGSLHPFERQNNNRRSSFSVRKAFIFPSKFMTAVKWTKTWWVLAAHFPFPNRRSISAFTVIGPTAPHYEFSHHPLLNSSHRSLPYIQ